jgi:hypothetical protein
MAISGVTISTGVTLTSGITASGDYIGAIALATGAQSPGIAAYRWSDSSGVGTKYSDPSSLPTGTSTFVKFNPTGTALALTTSSSPYVHVYAWDRINGFGTKYSNPSSLPAQRSNTRPSWTTNLFGMVNIASISVYRWDDTTGFGTKYTQPTITGQPQYIAINPYENAIAIGAAAGNTRTWQFNLTTGFNTGSEQVVGTDSTVGTWGPNGNVLSFKPSSGSNLSAIAWNIASATPGSAYTNPAQGPSGNEEIAWNYDQSTIFVGGAGSTPYVWAWPWSDATGFGTRYTAATAAGYTVNGISVSKRGASVAVTTNANNLEVYRWSNSTGWGSKYDVTAVTVNAVSVDFMP